MTEGVAEPGISTKSARVDDDRLWVDLDDGRTIGVPLAWFPRLLRATPDQRQAFELSRRGIHWEALDEDISVADLLRGLGDISRAAGAEELVRRGQILVKSAGGATISQGQADAALLVVRDGRRED